MTMMSNDTLYYFVDGTPRIEEISKASKLSKRVQFLNVHDFDVNVQNEKIKFVAGCVPETYLDRTVLDAVKIEPEEKKVAK